MNTVLKHPGPAGRATWILRYRYHGAPRKLTIFTLAQARRAATKAREGRRG